MGIVVQSSAVCVWYIHDQSYSPQVALRNIEECIALTFQEAGRTPEKVEGCVVGLSGGMVPVLPALFLGLYKQVHAM